MLRLSPGAGWQWAATMTKLIVPVPSSPSKYSRNCWVHFNSRPRAPARPPPSSTGRLLLPPRVQQWSALEVGRHYWQQQLLAASTDTFLLFDAYHHLNHLIPQKCNTLKLKKNTVGTWDIPGSKSTYSSLNKSLHNLKITLVHGSWNQILITTDCMPQ